MAAMNTRTVTSGTISDSPVGSGTGMSGMSMSGAGAMSPDVQSPASSAQQSQQPGLTGAGPASHGGIGMKAGTQTPPASVLQVVKQVSIRIINIIKIDIIIQINTN